MGNVIKVVNMGKNPYYDIEEELSAFAYTYDKSGFITGEIAKNGKRIETSQYQYDERGQLVKVSQTVTENNKFVEETEMVYTYDGAGNRLSAVKTSGDKALCNILYTYNDNSQITDIESDCDDNKQTHVILTYDENGNLKNTTCNDTEKVRDYTYDNENRLKAVKENGSLLMAALYDGNGDRIFRLDYRKNSDYVSNQAGTAENVYYPSGSVNSAYDTDAILNEMLIPNGVTNNTAINYELTGYINDINTEYTQTLMEFGANGNTTNVYEYGDGRNSATINGTKGYYLYDGRGSVAGLTGNSGGSMITYRYDVYGNTIKSNNTLNNPYQYNAEYTDSSTGLQYLRARYYDSSQGRFTTKDTLLGSTEKPITRNLYTYCGNNPLNITDPSGHGWFKNAWNSVKKTATKAVNTVKNIANKYVVQPIKSFISDPKGTAKKVCQNIKTQSRNLRTQATQKWNNFKTETSTRWNTFKSDVSAKTQKAIEEAKRFVCTTKDRINTTWNSVKSWSQEQIEKLKNTPHSGSYKDDTWNTGAEKGTAYAYGYRGTANGQYGDLQGTVNGSALYADISGVADFGLFSGEIESDNKDMTSKHDVIPGLSLGVEANAGVADLHADGLAGTENLGVSGEVNAKVGTANAEAGIYIGGRQTKDKKGQEINAYVGAEAMASAASGDASVGLVVLGHEVQVTVSGHAGSIGGSVHAGYKEGELGFGADLAAIIGVGFDVTIKKR